MLGLIPAAGKGTRFLEIGKHYPKCILPYKETPIIVHNIRTLLKSGCTKVIVGVSHQSHHVTEVVNRYFGDEVEVVHIYDSFGMPDTLDTMMCGVRSSDYDDVMIILGDVVVNGELTWPKERCSWVATKVVEDYSRWCIAVINQNDKVLRFEDKSTERPDSNSALTGVYYFSDYETFKSDTHTSCLDHKDNTVEMQLSTVMTKYFNNYEDIIAIQQPVIDLGTYEDYIENRGIDNSRAFNTIKKVGRVVSKSSNNTEKIRAEYHWFKDLPIPLKPYVPTVYELNMKDKVEYTMEFIPQPTLRELYLFQDGSTETWDMIFSDLMKLQLEMSKYSKKNLSHEFLNSMLAKTKSRVSALELSSINTVRYNDMLQEIGNLLRLCERPDSLAHGDFCFSNIMWSKSGVKMIDPRGEYYGSIYYEMAKLYHSVIGHYDFIDAELYSKKGDEIVIYDEGKEHIEKLFLQHLEGEFNEHEVLLIKFLCASLFISMIPLHYHNHNNQALYLTKFEEILDDALENYDSL